MTKRKDPPLQTLSDDSDPVRSDREEQTAQRLVQTQRNKQLKRRSTSNKPYSRARTSVWSTISAVPLEGEKPRLECRVCLIPVHSNQSWSSSNLAAHYKSVHHTTYKRLVNLNKQNAADALLKAVVDGAREEYSTKDPKSGNAKSKKFFPSASSSKKNKPSNIEVPEKTMQAVALVLYASCTERPILTVSSPVMQGLVSILMAACSFPAKSL